MWRNPVRSREMEGPWGLCLTALLVAMAGCERDRNGEWGVPDLEAVSWTLPEGSRGVRENRECAWTTVEPGEGSWSLGLIHRLRLRGVHFSPKEWEVEERLSLERESLEGRGPRHQGWRVSAAEARVSPPMDEAEERLQEALVLSAADGDARREMEASLTRVLEPLAAARAHLWDAGPWPFALEETRELPGGGEWNLRREGQVEWSDAVQQEHRTLWGIEGNWRFGPGMKALARGMVEGMGRGRWWVDAETGRLVLGEVAEAGHLRFDWGVYGRWIEWSWTTEIRLWPREEE